MRCEPEAVLKIKWNNFKFIAGPNHENKKTVSCHILAQIPKIQSILININLYNSLCWSLEVCKQTELLTLSNYFRYILEEITNQRDENTSSFVQLDISLNPNSFSVRVSRALTTNAGGSLFHETAQFSSHITYICNHQASQTEARVFLKLYSMVSNGTCITYNRIISIIEEDSQ